MLALGKHDAEALAARERALTLDGSDLSLRRMVERARTGKEILAAFAIDGRAALKAFDARGANVDGSSVLVVDAAATQAFADGSMVDRIHTVEKVLDQSAVARVAEVQVPQGAQVLALRTLKADGTVLEPESLDKDTVSLPGVGVGDAVEAEYLLAHPSRRAASPGWTAGAFYFQVGGVADDWATYAVTAPRGSGMSVDAHNMRAPRREDRGGARTCCGWRCAARRRWSPNRTRRRPGPSSCPSSWSAPATPARTGCSPPPAMR